MGDTPFLTRSRFCFALGTFDGVHLGHRLVLEKLIEVSRAAHATPVVLTFGSELFSILGKDTKMISTFREKELLLERMGIACKELPTNTAFLGMSGAQFVQWLGNTGVISVVAGVDYTFGCDRLHADDLETLCRAQAIGTRLVPLRATPDGQKISSSRIRQRLIQGDIPGANALLGYPYTMVGKVVHGRGEGHLFGIPTANLSCPASRLLPAYGVYLCHAAVGGKEYRAVVNVGTQPTFSSDKVCVEALLGDGFCRELYGEELELRFNRMIRPIIRFDSAEALKRQIQHDLAEEYL